jgi:O-antigen biosynthesis protein
MMQKDSRAPTIGAIAAFVEETNSHSRYNIFTLADAIKTIGGIQLVAIANWCSVSEKMRSRFGEYPFVSLVEEQQNIGIPAAWNRGLDALSGCDHVLILNDDVWLDRVCADRLIEVLASMPDTAVAGVEGVVCATTDGNGFPKQKKRFGKKKGMFQRSRIRVRRVSNVSGFLFALSMGFVRATGFRFDTRYTPAFCEEFDCAFFARSRGYRARIVTGLDDHYEHIFGVSSAEKTIRYLDKSITTRELSTRNMKLFTEKWAADMKRLIKP